VIGILNRWRQFGRRYFWPHLLLGMVAASLGVSTSLSASELATTSSTSCSLNRLNIGSTGLSNLALLQAHRRPGYGVDYWQQHALRTVIRHLSFAMVPPVNYTVAPLANVAEVEPLHVQQLALLHTLNALLTHESRPATTASSEPYYAIPSLQSYQPGLWLAQKQGIRAGPFSLI